MLDGLSISAKSACIVADQFPTLEVVSTRERIDNSVDAEFYQRWGKAEDGRVPGSVFTD